MRKFPFPVIFGQRNSKVPAQKFQRSRMGFLRVYDIAERPYFTECVEHEAIERPRVVFIHQRFQNHPLGVVIKQMLHTP